MSDRSSIGEPARLTVTNTMAGDDFPRALDRHLIWGMHDLDLRDGIYGRWLADVSVDEARRAAEQIRSRGMSVHCLSSVVFDDEILKGKDHFVREHLARVEHLIDLAEVLQPTHVRLIAAKLTDTGGADSPIDALARDHRWLVDQYREAIDRIADRGFPVTIENEFGPCLLANSEDFVRFFDLIDRNDHLTLTWDAQNQWAAGEMPTLAAYEQLKPFIGYFHVKGGKAGPDGELAWNAALEDADWPVLEITQKVIDDQVSPVICLNVPAHGQPIEDYDYGNVTEKDLAFLRAQLNGVI